MLAFPKLGPAGSGQGWPQAAASLAVIDSGSCSGKASCALTPPAVDLDPPSVQEDPVGHTSGTCTNSLQEAGKAADKEAAGAGAGAAAAASIAWFMAQAACQPGAGPLQLASDRDFRRRPAAPIPPPLLLAAEG